MSILKIDIEGLDLVLGGGIHLLERLKGSGESATLLIRGSAGSGKTVLGSQLAASIAHALQTDVAYGCVELLPTELRAQHEGIRKPDSREQVVILAEPQEANEPDSSFVRLYSAVLDLGEEGDTVKHLGGALEELLDAAKHRAGREVRVVVIDSLSTGYGLGANAPRVLADGVCKLAAERGLIIILLEELSDEVPSVWSFAVDTVFELKLLKQNRLSDRQLIVSKNRLGPSTAGPHEFGFNSRRGVWIYPSETAYLGAWRSIKLPSLQADFAWPPPTPGSTRLDWLPPLQRSVAAVIGQDSATLRRAAFQLGRPATSPTNSALDLLFIIGAHGFLGVDLPKYPTSGYWIAGWHPDLKSGPQMMAEMRSWFTKLRREQKQLFRVIIGDLRDAQSYAKRSDTTLAVSTLAPLLRSLGVPLILFETTEPHDVRPLATSLADTVFTIGRSGQDDGGPYIEARVADAFGREDDVTFR